MDLKKYTLPQIKKIASSLQLEPDNSRSELEKEISNIFSIYEEQKYIKTTEIGREKDVIFYNVKESENLILKLYKKTKSGKKIKKEYSFLRKAGKNGISPRAVDYDTIHKYIIMEKMEKFSKSKLTKKDQERIIEILDSLDNLKIYYNNPELNYVIKNGKIYLTNFSNAKDITPSLIKKLKTIKPNRNLLLICLISKMKENNFEYSSYKYLLKHVSEENREKYLKDI